MSFSRVIWITCFAFLAQIAASLPIPEKPFPQNPFPPLPSPEDKTREILCKLIKLQGGSCDKSKSMPKRAGYLTSVKVMNDLSRAISTETEQIPPAFQLCLIHIMNGRKCGLKLELEAHRSFARNVRFDNFGKHSNDVQPTTDRIFDYPPTPPRYIRECFKKLLQNKKCKLNIKNRSRSGRQFIPVDHESIKQFGLALYKTNRSVPSLPIPPGLLNCLTNLVHHGKCELGGPQGGGGSGDEKPCCGPSRQVTMLNGVVTRANAGVVSGECRIC